MPSLRERLEQSTRFLVGTELVSVRGGMAERGAIKARTFASQLVEAGDVDWISVTDNGKGGAVVSPGSGLAGVERRLGTFDGVLAVSSPAGGPTMVTMEIPCALS